MTGKFYVALVAGSEAKTMKTWKPKHREDGLDDSWYLSLYSSGKLEHCHGTVDINHFPRDKGAIHVGSGDERRPE